MRVITRTVYGSGLQTALLLNLPYAVKENSTLNEKFNVLPTAVLDNGVIPHVGYFCIGNGGHRVSTGADGIPFTSPINHRASDAALFNHLPFVLRELDNDLTIAQRENYGLRTTLEVGGVEYIAYYLKRLDSSSTQMLLNHTFTLEGVTTTTEFVPNADNLNPSKPELPNDGVISTDGNYLTASAILPVIFDQNDVSELLNVARIIYNSEDLAVISEIGLCSGVDKVVSATSGGSSFNYREVIATQIVSHITGYYPVGFANRGFEIAIEAGASEPLLGERV